ncbi:MAG: putative Ig domain-containing protein, partial [Blastocatellia bacterium]
EDVTVTNIVNTNGVITAVVTADCKAKVGADTITLKVTDGGGLTATADLTVNVTANTPPTLGNYPAVVTINLGAGTIVTPDAPPTDNGTISLSLDFSKSLKATLSVNSATGTVTISDPNSTGTYAVTVKAKDNCGATSTRTFQLKVNP